MLVGPDSAQHAVWLWSRAGEHLAAALRQYDGVAIVDAGRLREDPRTSLRTGGTLSAIVLRPRADELAIAAARLSSLDESERPPLILVGDRPYGAAEVAAELGCEVLGVIADDERAVDALWLGGSPRQLLRSAFARSIRSLADTVAGRVDGRNDRRRCPARDGLDIVSLADRIAPRERAAPVWEPRTPASADADAVARVHAAVGEALTQRTPPTRRPDGRGLSAPTSGRCPASSSPTSSAPRQRGVRRGASAADATRSRR